MIRTSTSIALAIALGSFGVATDTHAGGAAPAANANTAGPSTAVTKEIVDAIASEVVRATTRLRIANEQPPYFIGLKVTEVEVNDVVSSLGSPTWKKTRHSVSLDARVHVGSYDEDNSNFVVANFENTDGYAAMPLPTEATPRIAKRVAWLVTDTAYKEALEQMRAKTDTKNAGGLGNPSVKSYTKQPPIVQEEPVFVPNLEPLDQLQQRANRISRMFRKQPNIHDSRVAFTSFLERRWYINSEGTSAHDTRRVSGVLIAASSQADDGQELMLYYTKYGLTAADLPSDKVLEKQAIELSTTLGKLRTAPVVNNYTGPVLMEGAAAAAIARYTLAPHLGGTPLPHGMSAAEQKLLGGGLSGRLGQRVVSKLLTVYDDPTILELNGEALIGGYRFDDEGVPSQRVKVIDKGELNTLLTSRTPSDSIAASNGHARRSTPGGAYHGSATNLIIKGTRGQTRKRLIAQLLREAKDQGMPYAIIIRRLDDPAATALPELSMREILQLMRSTNPESPPISALAYRVYPNGKEELIRGVQLQPVSLRAWRDVIGVGKDATVFNFLASGEHHVNHKAASVRDGSVPSTGVESAIVTPDLLFRELDIVGSTAGRRIMPLVPRPSSP